MPDKAANPCGVWFDDIVVPPDLKIEDNNQCFQFKYEPSKWIHLCMVEKFRPLRSAKFVIKKFYTGCLKSGNSLSLEPLDEVPVEDDEEVAVLAPTITDIHNGVF